MSPIKKEHGQIMTTFTESSKLVVDAIKIFRDIIYHEIVDIDISLFNRG